MAGFGKMKENTCMASTRYPESIETHAVKTASQIIASHWDISGTSSSSEPLSLSPSYHYPQAHDSLSDTVWSLRGKM